MKIALPWRRRKKPTEKMTPEGDKALLEQMEVAEKAYWQMEINLLLAEVYRACGLTNFNNAREKCLKILEIDPQHPDALRILNELGGGR